MTNHTEYLKVYFTDADITDRARELAAANQLRASLEQRKREIDAELKGQIEAENSKMLRLSSQISMGYEYQDVECRVELDTPEPGRKTIIRLDTGEEVKVAAMDAADRQASLDLASFDEFGADQADGKVTIEYHGESVDITPIVATGGGGRRGGHKRNPDAEGFADGSAEDQ